MFYYEVAPVTTVTTSYPTLTYHSESELALGQLVRISIGRKTSNGVVLEASKKPEYKTKPIIEELPAPLVPKQLRELAQWLSDYYLTHMPIVWQTMLPRGLEKTRRKTSEPSINQSLKPLPKLSKAQVAATKQISKNTTTVLQGVTGSGKTMVYIAQAQAAQKAGKSSIVLVPEIGLTAQLITSIQQHISPVFITHSRMTEAERHSAWLAIAAHDGPVVIVGPRSALFSPRQDIGLIVIDEFHEPSYKQDQNPKYSAVRAASQLSKIHKARLILGSATPAITEKYLAELKPGALVRMDDQINRQAQAKTIVVDMKKDKPVAKSWLSLPAKKALDWALANDRQALVFHNRRGSASSSLCNNCGWVATCPNCYLPLTLHADWHQVRCHICDHKAAPPTSCPDCGHSDLVFKGQGTKQLETDLISLYPGATVARFDTDNDKDQTLEQRYDDLHSGKINIIVGTQTVAKGLDLPKLDVVIVPLADVGLFIPDYTASERTFQLIHQVSGRVGRHSSDGKVIVQTYSPDHPAIQQAAHGDFDSFYRDELHQRQVAKYPPFVYLMKITGEYASAVAARTALSSFAGEVSRQVSGIQILGPAPGFHERFHDRYRWQLVIKARSRQKLQAVAELTPQRYHIDIDPSTLL